MKRTVKAAWSFVASMLLVTLFFFFLVEPARAPVGGKRSLGGRTIASLQEEEFDKKLLRLQLCYGVKVAADDCTVERRRVCKALVVHHLETALAKTGASLREPLEFRCEDTALSRNPAAEDGVVTLRPNSEQEAIEQAIQRALHVEAGVWDGDRAAREACEFLTDCKWSMRPQALSLRKLASCATTTNLTHRKILFGEVGTMVFRAKASRHRSLYAELLETAGK